MPPERSNSPADPFFETKKPAILEIWSEMQQLQSDFCLPQEMSFYFTSPQWHAATRVLDLGTGNGYYLKKVAAHFPEKIYHGVDSSSELIAIAGKDMTISNVTFAHRDLFDESQTHDFVIMRLLLQHLSDVPTALDHVAGLTNPGGSALIIDAHDPLRFFYPALPEFMQFFTTYAEHEQKAGRNRHVSSLVQRAIAGSSFWRLEGTLQLLIPSTIPGNLDLFTKTYGRLVDLVETVGELQYDFEAVRRAWQRWSAKPGAYTQVGLNLILLSRC
jgi:2-polyprenyl-3-methyl-5-hydroxy-6-metoxy-1,4-benzoquinol methylase